MFTQSSRLGQCKLLSFAAFLPERYMMALAFTCVYIYVYAVNKTAVCKTCMQIYVCILRLLFRVYFLLQPASVSP